MKPARGKDTVALVTGGANGIGEGIAFHLAKLGIKVVIADVDEEAGEAVAQEIDGHFVHCDVSEFADNQAAVAAAVKHYGDLHIVALNAGITSGYKDGERFDPVRCRRAVEVNFLGPTHGVNAAYPALSKSGGGHIIVTASIGGLYPAGVDPVYEATKAGVVHLVRSLALRWQSDDVQVNALCPGYTDTAMIEGVREALASGQIPVLEVQRVVQGFATVLADGRTGNSWPVIPGLPVAPFEFGKFPGFDEVYGGAADVRPRTRRTAPEAPASGSSPPAPPPGKTNGPLRR